MTLILLYSHANEPITRALLSSNLEEKNNFVPISLSILLNEVSIFDEFDEREAKIEWTMSSGQKITNSNACYLINRVISIPENLVSDFLEEDRAYSLAEFRAYLAFAIEAFPRTFSKPGAFGLAGNRYSLPRQWEIIKESDFSIKTPKYYLGNMVFCPLQGDLVYTNPFDFYYWRSNKHLVDIEKASFAFLKPEGMPIVSCVIGNRVKVVGFKNADEVSGHIYSRVQEISVLISHLFEYNISEILFFVENESLSFGMISNIPYAANKKEWFDHDIKFYFEDEIMRKYGKN